MDIATADFIQGGSVVDRGVKGHKMAEGDFIFHSDGDAWRRIVRTSDGGQKVKSGYLSLNDAWRWRDPSEWKSYTTYEITNFRRLSQGKGFWDHDVKHTFFYTTNQFKIRIQAFFV